MAETIETSGRTLDEAKKAAAEALGLRVEQCDFEVLEQNTKGLFSKTNVKVRAQERKATMRAAVSKPAEKTEAAAKPERAERKPKSEKSEKVEKTEKVETEEAVEREPVIATDADGEEVRKVLQGLFDAGELNIQAEVTGVTGRYVNLTLKGDDVVNFVDGKSPALDSLQYLSNAMLSRVYPTGVRVTIDANEYRAGRSDKLEKLALEVAEQVRSRKQEAVLDALPAHERRVIHKVLLDFDGVETYSEGEEPARRVVISPL